MTEGRENCVIITLVYIRVVNDIFGNWYAANITIFIQVWGFQLAGIPLENIWRVLGRKGKLKLSI